MPEYYLRVYPGAVALSWKSQVGQYPERGEPGISYFAGRQDTDGREYPEPIHCLCWRDEEGILRGVLNYYAVDYPPWEVAGNVNVFVEPSWKHQGIGAALVSEAHRRWGINWTQQRYTREGLELAMRMIPRLEGSEWQREHGVSGDL